MELLLTSNSSYNQTRSIIRDLANRELRLPVESQNSTTRYPNLTIAALAALTLAAIRWLLGYDATRVITARKDGATISKAVGHKT
jgi:hypothetical protein